MVSGRVPISHYLSEGAVDNTGTDGFLKTFGFLSHDPKLLLSKVKAVLDKSSLTSVRRK